jgi:hypothetical protein
MIVIRTLMCASLLLVAGAASAQTSPESAPPQTGAGRPELSAAPGAPSLYEKNIPPKGTLRKVDKNTKDGPSKNEKPQPKK